MCPNNWIPKESLYFSLSNSILSLTTTDEEATITVRYFPKSSLDNVNSNEDFNNYMINDLLKRGLIRNVDIQNIQPFASDDKRPFIVYPSELIITHFNLEYSDAYYCIEMIYSGDDKTLIEQMLDIGQSFVGVGNGVIN